MFFKFKLRKCCGNSSVLCHFNVWIIVTFKRPADRMVRIHWSAITARSAADFIFSDNNVFPALVCLFSCY